MNNKIEMLRREHDERHANCDKVLNDIKENMDEKRYVVQVYEMGCPLFPDEEQVFPNLYWKTCSTTELGELIRFTKQPFVRRKGDIKKWGYIRELEIEPYTEELERAYLNHSKTGYFESIRNIEKNDETL